MKKQGQKGAATLELLIAFAILVLNITAVILLISGGQSIYVDSETNTEAIAMAQELLEDARADAELDFGLVNNRSETEASGPLTYTKTLSVTQTEADLFTKKVTSTVSWPAEGGRNLIVEFTTLLTNPEAVDGGDTCSSVLSGDWTNPQMTSYEFGKDLVGDPSSGFPIGDIDINNSKLYVVVNNSNGNNMPTFFKLDVSEPSDPPNLLESMDNNPSIKTGLNSVAIADNYAYVANANKANYTSCAVSLSCSQLQVIDTDSMSVIGKIKIPGVTGNGGQAIGTKVFYKDGIVYLGLAKTLAGPEFNVIDVGGGSAGGSPSNPVYLGGFSIGNGVNDIFVRDDYAYVASPNDQELKVIKVSSPNFPFQVGQYNAPGGGGNNGNGKSLALVGNTLSLGRTLLNGNEFYILSAEEPETNLPVLGSKNITDEDGNNTSVNGIIVRDFLTFLLTNDDFQVLEINDSTNPYTISEYANPLPTPGGSGTTMDCEGNYIYFASLPSNDKGYIAKVTAD